MGEAFAVLETAFELRPDDGELLLYGAKVYASNGNFDRAATLLDRAKEKAPYASGLRTAADLALYRGELATALELWQRIVETQPLAMDANRSVVRLLAETKGNTAALEFLQQACDHFPHSYALHQLWSQWLYDEDPTLAEQVLRHLIEINPVDAWARRQLALVLGKQRRFEEAFQEADIAYQLYPNSPSYYCVYGKLCVGTGKLAEAKDAYREAIRLSVDTEGAISQLLSICDSSAERREALDFVYQELVRQVIFGDGLLAYWEQARYVLEADELLTKLRAALEARPDLWHAWSAMIRQLGEMNQLDEALELAQQGTERFPLLPRMWFDLSWVCRSRQDREGEIKALKQALQISPNWGTAVRQLSEVYEQAEEFDQSRQLLEEAIARTPLDPYNYGCLADLLWKLNEKETAIANLEKAVQLEPGYTWAWNTLRDWSRELQRKEVAVQLARDLTVRRGGEARSWLLLAETLTQPEELEERLAALNQALALNPRYLDAIDLKAKLLAQAQRYEEALATCHSDACQWLCDWQGRSDLKPWMLSNLAEALRGLKQDKESNRVSKHALTLAADHATYIHRLWLAFDEALAGRSPLAANQLRQVDFSSIEPYYQFLYLLAQAMLEAQAKSEKRQHRFNEARSQLRKGLTAYPTFGKNLLMRRAYHQCVWLLAKDSRSLVALMWALWQWVSR